MTREIRKDLNKAKQLYRAKKHQEAFEIYERHFSQNPDKFDYWDRVRYCWCMYYLFIRDSDDECEIIEYSEIVTQTVRQSDLNTAPVCVYAQCVFKVIMILKSNQDWEFMMYWLDKLNPDLLSDKEKDTKDSIYPSKKEDYYRYLSTAHLKCEEYQECIDTSMKALNTIESFAFNGDVWHMWRIAKSLNCLDQPQDALDYLNKVIEVQDDWYILKEIADCYYKLGDNENAVKYASRAVLTDDDADVKVNLYYLIYVILKDSDSDAALKHAQLYLALKIENGGTIADDIDDLDIDEANLDSMALKNEIEDYWLKT